MCILSLKLVAQTVLNQWPEHSSPAGAVTPRRQRRACCLQLRTAVLVLSAIPGPALTHAVTLLRKALTSKSACLLKPSWSPEVAFYSKYR